MVEVLRRLGLLEGALALGAPPLIREYNYEDGESNPQEGPPQDPGTVGYCLSVRREPLDEMLVRRACATANVELLEGTRLIEVVHKDGRVAGARLATPQGERLTRARVVVGADGRHSLVAQQVAAAYERDDPPYRALYYRYLSGFSGVAKLSPDAAEFSSLGDELAYVFPSDSGLCCVALSINRADYLSMRRSLASGFEEHLSKHKGIWQRFERAKVESKLFGSRPEPNYVRIPVGTGWALVGDAGMHQDPWTGQGIDMASMHATFLAEELMAWFGGEKSEKEALSAFHARRNEHGLDVYDFTVTVAEDLRKAAEFES